jgi:hypothetical protein
MMLDDRFSRWVRSVQAHNRLTLGWIRAYEPEPERHIHAVLLAAAPLDCFHAAMMWREQIALRYPTAAMVEPYEYGIGGLAYVLGHWTKISKTCDSAQTSTGFVQQVNVLAPLAIPLRESRFDVSCGLCFLQSVVSSICVSVQWRVMSKAIMARGNAITSFAVTLNHFNSIPCPQISISFPAR